MIYPFVSVIITSYNNEDSVQQCLESVINLDYPKYEIIFVDGGSRDTTVEQIKKYGFKPLYDYHEGVAAARNIGIKSAKGEIYVFSDADCIFEREWIKKLIQPFADKTVGVVGGPDEAPWTENLIERCIDYTLTSFIGTAGLRRGDFSLGKYYPRGCNHAVRKESIEVAGTYNDELKNRGEEIELAHRIKLAGYKIAYVKGAKVWHRRRTSLSSFWTQIFKSGQAWFDILKIAPNMVDVIHLLPSFFVLFLLFSSFTSLFNNSTRLVLVTLLSLYLITLFLQASLGSIKMRGFSPFLILPLSTAIIHFAYGLGFLSQFLKMVSRSIYRTLSLTS